jgi:hypothetical protein
MVLLYKKNENTRITKKALETKFKRRRPMEVTKIRLFSQVSGTEPNQRNQLARSR